MIDLKKIDEIVSKLSDSLPPGAAQLRDDLETRFRSVLQKTFARMELVTREEFDAQRSVLARVREKLDALEQQLDRLERD